MSGERGLEDFTLVNLSDLVSLLQQKGVGMNEPLVDCEGYPRSDVDLYQVRTARHNIVCEWPSLGTFSHLVAGDA